MLRYKGGGFFSERLEEVRRRIARHVNCSPEEIAFTHGTTEALSHVLFG
jgi:selenocysteine lyase/cysteine desulfurase